MATQVSGYHADSHGLHSPHRRDGAGIHPAVSWTPPYKFLVESKQSLSSSLTISSICQIELVVCMIGINSAVTESEHHKQT